MDLNKLQQSLSVIFRDAHDGEVGGEVYGYHDQVEVYPSIELTVDQIEDMKSLGWLQTEDGEGWMHFT